MYGFGDAVFIAHTFSYFLQLSTLQVLGNSGPKQTLSSTNAIFGIVRNVCCSEI
jgi:hypothetical protein